MTEPSLKEKTARGLLWGGLSNGLQQGLNLLFGILLARMLTPADYGMVGMLTIFSLIAGTLQESGFISALANRREVSQRDYDAVFWFSAGVSLVLYVALFFLSPLIARFYGEPELTALARYSFLGFLMASLGTAPSAYLFRGLMVRQKAQAAVVALVLSGTVGVVLAYHGFAYWGIATQSLVYTATVTACYWIFSGWRPTLRIDFRPLRGLFAYSSRLIVTNLFTHVNNNFFSVILGRFYTGADVGNYNQANKWNTMGHSLISGMVGGVAQPVLARVGDDAGRQARVFRKMLRFTAFVSFPAMLGLSLVAPELITIAVTDKWAASADILRLLCVGGAFVPVTTLYSNLILSQGRSSWFMRSNIVQGLVQLAAALLLYRFGLYVMFTVYVAINIAWLLVWHAMAHRTLRLTLLSVMTDILPFAAVAAGAMVVAHLAAAPLTSVYAVFAVKVVVAAVVYVGVMYLFGAATLRESMDYLFKKRSRHD